MRELGVGLIYMPSLEPVLLAGQGLVDVVEIEPEPYWSKIPGEQRYRINHAALQYFSQLPYRLLLHGVGFPIGGTIPPADAHTEAFIETIQRLGPVWVSEHMSFNRAADRRGCFDTGFLLPPLQSAETVSIAVDNIRHLQQRLPVPFAFETGVNYLQPQADEMSDGQFWAAVADAADCGILLDLHNLYCNQVNGRQPVLEVIDELPLERVWEVHLAGGQDMDGYWLDAHSGPAPPALMELAREVIPRLPNLKAINFEIMEEYLTAHEIKPDTILTHLQDIRALWATRGRRAGESNRSVAPSAGSALPSPAEWEALLGHATTGDAAAVRAYRKRLGSDPGIDIFRRLIQSVRGGMAADGLHYSVRLLLLSVGLSRVETLLAEFWGSQKPGLFPQEECRRLAEFLRRQHLNLPYLSALLDYDLAVLAVKNGNGPVKVSFDTDPDTILAALDRGKVPAAGPPQPVLLSVQ